MKAVRGQRNAFHLMTTSCWCCSECDLLGLCCCRLCLQSCAQLLPVCPSKTSVFSSRCVLDARVRECGYPPLLWFKAAAVGRGRRAAVTRAGCVCNALLQSCCARRALRRAESNPQLQQRMPGLWGATLQGVWLLC